MVALVAVVLAGLLWQVDPAVLAVWIAALAWLGMPHGAADDRIARPLLRPVLGRLWLPVFFVGYLTIAAMVMVVWACVPGLNALAFLVVAALHFGIEETNPRYPGEVRRHDIVEIAARGGLPFALPFLLHPDRTGAFLATLTGGAWPEASIRALALLWIPLAAWAVLRARRNMGAGAVRLLALAAAMAALPPLAAFLLYYLAVHVPLHMAQLARRHDAGDAGAGWTFALRAGLPMTLAAVPLFALVFWSLDGDTGTRFVRATFMGIWALTLPHVLLDLWDARHGGGRLI